MEGKGSIFQYRGRLDKTLASPALANEETLKTLVKNQILRSSECEIEGCIDNVVEKRTKDVSNFVGMLRSASINDHERPKSSEAQRCWKIKQDTEEIRVMYREGPEGTPFHALLAEGYVDGPADVCMCISWESGLYKKWWPQTTVPTFKVSSSECLQKVRIGEQISLVRMKLSWPVSAREVLVHYFEFEYCEDDLIVVLLNSISDSEAIDKTSHGFSKDGIPDAQDVVRMDLVGGFAIQKVSEDRSYFRTIVNMDIKLDFVPPAFINFISRQLIGSGFKLYKKEVSSVLKGDEDFGKALKDPLYARIREALYAANKSNGVQEPQDLKIDTCIQLKGHPMETMQPQETNETNKVLDEDNATHSATEDTVVVIKNSIGEIEEIDEEEIEESKYLEEDGKTFCSPPTNGVAENCCINNKKKVVISAEVEQALGTLEKAISIFRGYGFNPKSRSLLGTTNEKLINSEHDATKDSKSSEDQICPNGGAFVEASKTKSMERTSHEPRNSSGSHDSRTFIAITRELRV
ncbi:unnamed protein product [Ilex paraguariensis]|uniref:START domain-containing protein n=1 Tax=Ilex paraguariensis TaxID=185542 RepID=A0ABC8SVC1_9AQUA